MKLQTFKISLVAKLCYIESSIDLIEMLELRSHWLISLNFPSCFSAFAVLIFRRVMGKGVLEREKSTAETTASRAELKLGFEILRLKLSSFWPCNDTG